MIQVMGWGNCHFWSKSTQVGLIMLEMVDNTHTTPPYQITQNAESAGGDPMVSIDVHHAAESPIQDRLGAYPNPARNQRVRVHFFVCSTKVQHAPLCNAPTMGTQGQKHAYAEG